MMTNNKAQQPVKKRISELKPGMALTHNIYSFGGCPLLQVDKELTSRDIRRLENWRHQFVYIRENSVNTAEKNLEKAS